MDLKRLANSGALKIKIYVPGKSKKEAERELNLRNFIKMASNENPHGPAPAARKAFSELAHRLNIYPDPVSTDLRVKLAGLLGCSERQITAGNGADGVIYNLGMAIIDQGDEVIIPEVTFSVYETITRVMRGVAVFSGMRNLRIDLESIKRKITEKTKAVFLCNPNNPTGDALPRDELAAFLHEIPAHVLIVLDEAYIDFMDSGFRPDSLGLLKKGMDNLFILRTLSKIYGLAGVRVGYGIGAEELVSLINRVKPPFDVSIVAENIALDALSDDVFVKGTLEDTFREKEFFYRELDGLGLEYVRSHTNFILIDTGLDSTDIFNRLMRKGIIVRPTANYNLSTSIRVTLGRHEENIAFFKAFKEVLLEAS